jgi:ABC-2 type transport system permease protein
MIKESLDRIIVLTKKNIFLYIRKGPVLIFGLLFPFFMALSWVIGRNISSNQIFIGIIAMTSFFTSTAISPVILPIETREKSLERILSSPLSLTEILMGIVLASSLYSAIITSIVSFAFIFILSIEFISLTAVFLMFLGIFLMAILGSLLGLLISAKPTDMTSDVMILINLIKFPLLFISGIFIPLQNSSTGTIMLSFLSPTTFLADLFRFCVDGSNFFNFEIDILMLVIWIFLLFIASSVLHSKTMPKRFSDSGKSTNKSKKKPIS